MGNELQTEIIKTTRQIEFTVSSKSGNDHRLWWFGYREAEVVSPQRGLNDFEAIKWLRGE